MLRQRVRYGCQSSYCRKPGECAAVVVVETADLEDSDDAKLFCDSKLVFVDKPLLLIPIAWPAANEVRNDLHSVIPLAKP